MTDTTLTPDHGTHLDATIDGYLDCWNTTDGDERTELIERFWTTDARMVDPLVDVTGHAELAAVFTRFHETYPGCSFRRTGSHDAHHRLARWSWEMVDPNGNRVLAGLDVALLADDGRLQYVAGFFG
jgi:hypothetical protein